MAAPAVSAIRAGLAANLASLATAVGLQVSAYMLGSPTPPYIEVFPEEVTFDEAHGRGADEWQFIVRAFVGLTTDVGAQVTLDKLLDSGSSTSLKKAIEANPTLTGTVEDLRVVSATGYRVYDRAGGGPVLGCEWLVEVIALGA